MSRCAAWLAVVVSVASKKPVVLGENKETMRSVAQRSHKQLAPGLSVALAMLGALLAGSYGYRLRLLCAIQDPMQWADEPVTQADLFRQLGSDALLSVSVAAVVWLGGIGLGLLLRASWQRRLGLGLLSVLLLLCGMLSQAQHGTIVAMHSGLTLTLLKESLDPAAIRESWALLPRSELPYLLLPLGGFWLIYLAQTLHRVTRLVVAGGIGVLTVGLLTWALRVPAAPMQEALLHHPLGFVATELWNHRRTQSTMPHVGVSVAAAATRQRSPDEAGEDPQLEQAPDAQQAEEDTSASLALPVDAKRPTMALLSSQFVYSDAERPIHKKKPSPSQEPLNVIVLLLESTGADYALSPLPNGKLAMPFLRSLCDKGLWLQNHFSAGNSSPRGIFSLMSGLYVMPEVGIWDVRKDIYLPSLSTYLPSQYQRFLVTPASLDWYFPHAYMLHSGFSDLVGYHNLPIRKNAPGGRAHARDEAETVSVFLQKLSVAAQRKEPFVAVYYSFLAHWPYPDYGKESHVTPPTRPIHLYYNNLHYLDGQLERIYKKADELGLLDKTVIVIAGDHGEAFGQHPHNYTHSRQSFNENYRTPALILHPKLFAPRVVTEPTSHVDFLPTLLDALGQKYDPQHVQGESLFQDRFRRKYIFLYGNEDTSSSISQDLIKLQISLRDGSCWTYDLKSDPGERKRLGCGPHRAQYEALVSYRQHQQKSLRQYNAVFRREQSQVSAPTAQLALPSRPASSL